MEDVIFSYKTQRHQLNEDAVKNLFPIYFFKRLRLQKEHENYLFFKRKTVNLYSIDPSEPIYHVIII